MRKQDDLGETSEMMPMYYWLMPTLPWVMAMRWAEMMLPPAPVPQTGPSAEIIPFPVRRVAGDRRVIA